MVSFPLRSHDNSSVVDTQSWLSHHHKKQVNTKWGWLSLIYFIDWLGQIKLKARLPIKSRFVAYHGFPSFVDISVDNGDDITNDDDDIADDDDDIAPF